MAKNLGVLLLICGLLSILTGIFFLAELDLGLALLANSLDWFIIGAVCLAGSFICISLSAFETSFNEFRILFLEKNTQLSSESVYRKNFTPDTSQNPSEVHNSDISREKQDDVQNCSCDICGKELKESQKYFCGKCRISICYACMKGGAKCPNCGGFVTQSL